MNNQHRQQALDQIQKANNVLVAVSANPTVDELAASIGLTIALNKMGKHATTVFSGVVPSTIEFLQPEKTIETTTDSLRDFIIALDKSKADKLRYKVENDIVRIFITPYRTSISDKDLDFSQGDFNVDVVVALGVTRKEDLDTAVTAHGRILHDATVISVTKETTSELGSINWQDAQASSLCEMIAGLTAEMAPEAIDGQMATALLTGIIAETDRFKNEKTTPLALSLSSRLMSSGANQKLIAEKLEAPQDHPKPHFGSARAENAADDELDEVAKKLNDGELAISHEDEKDSDTIDKIHIDEHGNLGSIQEAESPQAPELPELENLTPLDSQTADTPLSPPVELPFPEAPAEPYTPEAAEEPQEEPDATATPPVDTAVSPPPPPPNPDLPLPNPATPPSVEPSSQAADFSEPPTLPTPTPRPKLQHEKVIIPPSQEGQSQKSDKPFDLKEAMKEVGVPAVGQGPSEEVEATEEDATQPAAPPPPPPPMPPAPAPGGTQTLSQLEHSVASTAPAQPAAPPAPAPIEPAPAAPVTPSAPQQPLPPQKTEVTVPPPPPVPPPMTAPQFYDGNGKTTNPFLNPPK